MFRAILNVLYFVSHMYIYVDCFQVSNIIAKLNKEKAEGQNDGVNFMNEMKKDGTWFEVETNSDGVLQLAFWASREQRELAVRFGSVLVVDTTFNTNK